MYLLLSPRVRLPLFLPPAHPSSRKLGQSLIYRPYPPRSPWAYKRSRNPALDPPRSQLPAAPTADGRRQPFRLWITRDPAPARNQSPCSGPFLPISQRGSSRPDQAIYTEERPPARETGLLAPLTCGSADQTRNPPAKPAPDDSQDLQPTYTPARANCSSLKN